MPAAWPVVKARLAAALPDLAAWEGVEVYNGPPVTNAAPDEYLTVGFVLGEDFAGSYEQTRNGEGGWQGCLEETGTVRSELVVQSGDADDLPDHEARAFALVDAWETWLSHDETLAVLGPLTAAGLAVDVQPIQNNKGSAIRLTVTLSYITYSA